MEIDENIQNKENETQQDLKTKNTDNFLDFDDQETTETERLDLFFGCEPTVKTEKEVNSFFDRENARMIKSYGSDNYSLIRSLEPLTMFNIEFLKKNGISSKFR